MARLYCHAVISVLPSEALSEAVNDLNDLHLFYLSASAKIAQLPAGTIKAKLGKPISRPEIQIDRE